MEKSRGIIEVNVDEAMRLVEKIEAFLQECGGPYKNGIKAYVTEHIIICVALAQYIYKPGHYFACWWLVDDQGLAEIAEHRRPVNLYGGTKLYLVEFGCKDRSAWLEIRQELRKVGVKGVHWHRAGKGWRHYPKQIGARYGRQ